MYLKEDKRRTHALGVMAWVIGALPQAAGQAKEKETQKKTDETHGTALE